MKLIAFCFIFISSTVFAAVGVLPYENWLKALQTSLTGPVAFSISLIGIVSAGATLIFAGGEISRFMRTIIYIVLVMTFLVGANSLMTEFFNVSGYSFNFKILNRPLAIDNSIVDHLHNILVSRQVV